MRKLLTKYVILLIITFAVSILIYNYVESSKSVYSEKDLLITQKQLEDKYLSNTSYSIDSPNIIVNPYGNSPLTALVVFQTKDLGAATVTIKGKDGAKDLVHTFTPAKVHILPIYGLYSNYENKVIVEVNGKTKELSIKTEALPDDFAKITDIDNDDFESDDFYFTTPEDKGYTAAYDTDGEVRWYIIGDYKWDIQRLSNGHILMSSDKTISNNYSAGLMELDLLGKVYFEYAIPGGYHHNVYELNNGNLLVASNNLDGETTEDLVVEIDRNNGSVVKSIDLNKLLDNKVSGNWFKLNSLFYDVSTNSITLSGYNSNMIVNIDYSSLNINWIISNKSSKFSLVNGNNADYPNKPESINLLNNGYMVFSNLINDERYLTIYRIDYSNHTFNQIDSYKLGGSNAYLDVLNSNDYIVTSGNVIKEIINDDEVISLSINSLLYNTKRMPLYANDVYTGVSGIRLGNLGVSNTTRNHWLLSTEDGTSIIKKYKISLYKDVYGLKVAGHFNKNDKVQIILDNVLDKKTYDLKVNNGISTRYINEDGIKGKYYIYIKINGKTYKLLKYVIFY